MSEDKGINETNYEKASLYRTLMKVQSKVITIYYTDMFVEL